MKKMHETFLARWINKELTEEEYKNFKSSKEYISYKRILNITDTFKSPDYDLEEKFINIKDAKNKKRIKTLKPRWYIGIAASVIFLLGLMILFNFSSNTEYSSDFGKQLSFELPDGSKVTLNSMSTVSFNKENWKNNRTLTLDGEAFFEVKKGQKFKVQTTQGNVTVLGTEFNINTTNDYLKVLCYEGKVKVKRFNK